METQEILARIRRVRRSDAPPDLTLRAALSELDDATVRADAGRLLARVPASKITPPDTRLRPLRVAVTGTFTTEGVVPLLRVALLVSGIEPEIYVSSFDQLAFELSDPQAPLAQFAPDVTLCLLHDGWFLPQDWDPTDLAGLRDTVSDRLDMLRRAVAAFTERTGSTVLLHTVPLSSLEQRRVIAYKGRAQLGRIWRDLNSGILQLAEERDLVHAVDFELLLADHAGPARDQRLYRFASMAWSPTVERQYADEATAFCRAVVGLTKKCLVVDLDNTLWGGVLGDDGPGGIQIGPLYPGNCYVELQRAIKSLQRQGVVLGICSKNEQAIVDEVFDSHPELVLRTSDFVARAVNWERKDVNLQRMADDLNLGLQSFVYVDDSSFECEMIRQSLPDVQVVHVEGDPAGHLARLLQAGGFEVLATTTTDRERTDAYRSRAQRKEFASSFASADEYLRGLDLRVTVRVADDFSVPRLLQLALRTNQFNMVGGAHAEAQSRLMATSADHLLLGFEVADRFGREGIVGGVWIAKQSDCWLIENFIMSCRVFSRGVEHAVLQEIVDRAVVERVPRLEALFRPTERNRPAAAFYPEVGFAAFPEPDGATRFVLPLTPPPQVRPEWIVFDGKESLVNV